MAGAANIAGYVHEGDYAYGSKEAAVRAWQPLAAQMGCTVEQAAQKCWPLRQKKTLRSQHS